MSVLFAAALGLAGALVRDALELGDILRHRRGDWPEEWRSAAFVAAEVTRGLVGAALAAGLARFDQVGPVGAVIAGGVGPSVVQYALDPFRRNAR